MRVLQLIDSLNAGGAERMAVNIANILGTSNKIEKSYLCATREEGLLKINIDQIVKYSFLNKKRTLDIKAIIGFIVFTKKEKIDIVHAHSTSFFLATITKLFNNNIKLIWHDHYGNSEHLEKRSFKTLKLCSRYFSHIFSVNEKLKLWAKTNLKLENVSYLPNFAIKKMSEELTILKGQKDARIIHLSNLRPQKNHLLLINAFALVIKQHPNWTLHCVGKDFNDEYSKSIKSRVNELQLNKRIFFYGSKKDVSNILNQSDIGVLSSKSEGLPLSLLEYGLAKLPVIVTNVGDCGKVIGNENEGILIEPDNETQLTNAFLELIRDKKKRFNLGYNLNAKVNSDFNPKKIVNQIINIYNS